MPTSPSTSFSWRPLALYALMLLGTVAGFFVIRAIGEGFTIAAPAVETAKDAPTQHRSDVLLHVLLALVAVIVAGQVMGRIFIYLQQPPVIGEVVAGIMLGPSLLGAISPQAYAYLLPPAVGPYLGTIAQLGVVLYMFLVGLELDASVLRKRGHATLAISHASIVVPFLLGAALALGIFQDMAPEGVRFTSFALFMGAAMSVTAFPVLARILTDRQLSKTELGIIALACAATDDVTAWCLLAFVVGVAQADVSGALLVMALSVGYIAGMFLLVRPILARLIPQAEAGVNKSMVVLIFAGLFASAWLTEFIGIHAIFGAFLFGACIPHDSRLARELPHKLQDFVTVVLLPAFFAFTGMRTQISLISGWENWLWCGAIIAVATLGKFGGSTLMARVAGMSWRDASALGILMNTRGLMELIVLNIGLDLGVISPRLFAMMVIMALVTTIGTTPVLWLLGVRSPQNAKQPEPSRETVGVG
jgi:Kef-type K+ transport system membrane component KefB